MDELAGHAQISASEAEKWIALLTRLDYITAAKGRYRANIPVLTARDRPMVQELKQIGRKAIESWLDSHYPALKMELSDISPARWGVPFPESFTLIWHYVFGRANALLIEAGLLADPYAPGRKYKGFLPVVFDPKAL